jgi:tRNA 2-thiouridine synthesizing protein A
VAPEPDARVSPPRDPVVIDGGDRACVQLLLELRARISGLPAGTVIHLIASDPASWTVAVVLAVLAATAPSWLAWPAAAWRQPGPAGRTGVRQMRPVANPELPEIARVLPADAAYQIMRVAERLGFTDYSDVLAEVANAVTRDAARPGNRAAHRAPQLAASSFPHPPATIHPGDDHVVSQPPGHGSRLTPAHESPRSRR